MQAVVARQRASLLSKHGRNDIEITDLVNFFAPFFGNLLQSHPFDVSNQALSFFHYYSCVFDFETWALSVQAGEPVLKSSISGVSFPRTSVVVLDPIEGDRNTFSSFVVETADAMRLELYRVFQVFDVISHGSHIHLNVFSGCSSYLPHFAGGRRGCR